MNGYRRYGIYMVPQGALYARGAAWLGWDSVAGRPLAQPQLHGIDGAIADRPRKYGFHGTLKPPFRLAQGTDAAMLDAAMEVFCAHRAPLTLPRMALRPLGRFLAIVPAETSTALADLAAATVAGLDVFRDAPTAADLAKRRASGLSPRQEALLQEWGYPHVMDQFRFHLTLTGRLPADTLVRAQAVLAAHFADTLTAPVAVDSLCLMGEAADGRFHMLRRYGLAG